eukprot:jgi/Ulvmu1/5350/UM022_0144.1
MDDLIRWVGQEWLREEVGEEAAMANRVEELPENLQACNWRRTHLQSPQQSDGQGGPGLDCGVFTMMAMKRMYTHRGLDYDQHQVTSIHRAVCALECASLTLHGMRADSC